MNELGLHPSLRPFTLCDTLFLFISTLFPPNPSLCSNITAELCTCMFIKLSRLFLTVIFKPGVLTTTLIPNRWSGFRRRITEH